MSRKPKKLLPVGYNGSIKMEDISAIVPIEDTGNGTSGEKDSSAIILKSGRILHSKKSTISLVRNWKAYLNHFESDGSRDSESEEELEY